MPPPRPSSRRRRIAGEPPPGLFPARDDLLQILAVLSIAAAAATVCSLLNRRPQPYCDSLQSTDYDDGYEADSCQPCPKNGRCVGGVLQCIEGFKRYGSTCVEDGLLTQTANKISELLQRRICIQHARALCGKPAKILFQMQDISNMVDELLSKEHSTGLTEDGAELVKVRVLEIVRGLLDISLNSDKIQAFKCPEPVAEFHMPLACRIRQCIVRNIIYVTTFCILVRLHSLIYKTCSLLKGSSSDDITQVKFAALLWMLWSIYQKRALSNRAEHIYHQVCEILADNATNNKTANSESDPWVVASWLRDHLLVPRERKNASLWKKVEELILEDSRIDQYPKVIKGESKVVYEWQASGSLSARIKKVQGARGKSQTRIGTTKVSEELGGYVDEVGEHGSSCDSIRERARA